MCVKLTAIFFYSLYIVGTRGSVDDKRTSDKATRDCYHPFCRYNMKDKKKIGTKRPMYEQVTAFCAINIINVAICRSIRLFCLPCVIPIRHALNRYSVPKNWLDHILKFIDSKLCFIAAINVQFHQDWFNCNCCLDPDYRTNIDIDTPNNNKIGKRWWWKTLCKCSCAASSVHYLSPSSCIICILPTSCAA